jgi:F0F1-type ATP synthase gamma subunit
MGGLNQGVVRAAFAARESLGADKIALTVIGEKGAGILGDRYGGFKFFHGVNPATLYEQAAEVKDYIVKEVLERRMGRVMVAYPKPVSFSAQTIEVIGLLPCGELFDRDAQSVIARHWVGKGIADEARKVIVESSFSDMVEYLASVWVTSKLFEVFEDSKLAEFSARAMHLEGSQQKVEKNFKKLKHQFFKASHELIDKGMRESYAAKGGLKRKKKRDAEAA